VTESRKTAIFIATAVKTEIFKNDTGDNITKPAMAGVSSGSRWRRRPPHVEGSSEFLKQTVVYGRK
jgi:hypothetical protein